MKTVDYEGLEAVLRPVPDTVLVTLLTETRVDMAAKVDGQPNPYRGRVTKRSLVDGFVNFNYADRVNSRLKAEGKEPDFVPQPHGFAAPAGDEPSPFIRHRDGVRIYLPILVHWATQPGYYVDGHALAEEVITPWLKPRKVDEPEVYRNYALTSILEVTVADATYRIEHSVSAAADHAA